VITGDLLGPVTQGHKGHSDQMLDVFLTEFNIQ